MKKIKILSLFVALITLTSLLAVSCDEEYGDKNNFEPFVATAFDCFDTVTEFKAYFDEKEDFDKTWEEVHAILLEYHKLYDIYNTYPDMVNLATINNAEPDPETGHRTLKVDERIAELLDYGKDIYRMTNGNTNIAMGSLLSIWHEYHTEGKENPDKAALPSETELREAAKHMNMDSVEVDMETLTVTITDPLLKFDVGAIAKGFAAEKVIEHVARMNHHGVLLNVGGAISTIGQLPYGEKWVISLESPDKSGKSIHTFDDDPLPFDHMAVSGGYHRYYTVDGVNYGHIIDPDTLYPPTYFAAVCVHSHLRGPADVDALSTALFCMTEKEARELIEEENGLFHKGTFEVMWIYPDMTVSVTDGFYSMD